MPLRCFDASGQSIQSFDLNGEQWQALRHDNQRSQHLRMPCCGSLVTLKRSSLGTPFFAHKANGDCATAPESEEHLRLKQIAVVAARARGWIAETEVAGSAPGGEAWRADVLARSAKATVAIEIQWSAQTAEETLRRSAVYKASGVRPLWLFRQPSFPQSTDVPAVCVQGGAKQGFTALASGAQRMTRRDLRDPDRWINAIKIEEFLDAVFDGRFRFGVPLGAQAEVRVLGAPDFCWSCGVDTRVVTAIEIGFGLETVALSLGEIGKHPDLWRMIKATLPKDLGMGEIKPRYSSTAGHRYLSNGCVVCGRIQGSFYLQGLRGRDAPICSFSIEVSAEWQRAIDDRPEYEPTWGVYRPPPPPFPGVTERYKYTCLLEMSCATLG